MASASRRFGNKYPSRMKELHFHSEFFFNKFQPSPFVVPKLNQKLTAEEKYLQITKPWMRLKLFHDVLNPVAARLPDHYKKFFWQWKFAPKAPVHHIPEKGNFRMSHDGLRVEEIKDENIQVVFPENCNDGLWGGEGVVKGYRELARYKGQLARYWFPDLYGSTLYSEVLDKHMQVVVTQRLLNQVDDHHGLDNYLLKTPYADINSVLGFKMKREILAALAHKTLYPNDSTTREEVLLKYCQHLIPTEEIPWLGLTLDEAVQKQRNLEESQEPPRPLKETFRTQLLEYLQEQRKLEDEHKKNMEALEPEKDSSSMISKFNPFKKK